MRRKGVAFETRTLAKAEFRKELLTKVGEEASALPLLQSNTDIIAEMADVFDVLDAIQSEFKISASSISKQRKENSKKKGGFKKRVYLEWSQKSGYKTNERKGK